jgi:hypothetical protein
MMTHGRERHIDGAKSKHFYVLNSDFYGQQLSGERSRCCTKHSETRSPTMPQMKPQVLLSRGEPEETAFWGHATETGVIECVNVDGFLHITEKAVDRFLKVADSIIARSEQSTILLR